MAAPGEMHVKDIFRSVLPKDYLPKWKQDDWELLGLHKAEAQQAQLCMEARRLAEFVTLDEQLHTTRESPMPAPVQSIAQRASVDRERTTMLEVAEFLLGHPDDHRVAVFREHEAVREAIYIDHRDLVQWLIVNNSGPGLQQARNHSTIRQINAVVQLEDGSGGAFCAGTMLSNRIMGVGVLKDGHIQENAVSLWDIVQVVLKRGMSALKDLSTSDLLQAISELNRAHMQQQNNFPKAVCVPATEPLLNCLHKLITTSVNQLFVPGNAGSMGVLTAGDVLRLALDV